MLSLVEHYVSPQGEGPYTGVMTQFVRFAGCNMRCPGWPCDTQHAIDPTIWYPNHYKREPKELLNDCDRKANETGAFNICLTGGEPFMQNASQMDLLVRELVDYGFTIEAFSNGSFPYSEAVLRHVQIMMDWKLKGSGEATKAVEQRVQNALLLRNNDGIKFVVTGREDLEEARLIDRMLCSRDCQAGFWVGAAWGRISDQEIVEYVKEHQLDWRLNVQVHKHIWAPDERGV
jgi:7-carboxy-7-deazaguanine synthase